MFFVPCGQELMQLLCIFFTLYSPPLSLHLFPLPSPPSFPPFLFCSVALALYQSFLLSVSEDVRHGSVWVYLPSPPSLSHSSSLLCPLLSPFTRRRRRRKRWEIFSSFSPFAFFVLYVTAAKMRTNIWTKQGTWKFAWLSLLFADKITALHNTNTTHKLKHMRG